MTIVSIITINILKHNLLKSFFVAKWIDVLSFLYNKCLLTLFCLGILIYFGNVMVKMFTSCFFKLIIGCGNWHENGQLWLKGGGNAVSKSKLLTVWPHRTNFLTLLLGDKWNEGIHLGNLQMKGSLVHTDCSRDCRVLSCESGGKNAWISWGGVQVVKCHG